MVCCVLVQVALVTFAPPASGGAREPATWHVASSGRAVEVRRVSGPPDAPGGAGLTVRLAPGRCAIDLDADAVGGVLGPLPRRGRLEGTVRAADGRPLPGILVTLGPADRDFRRGFQVRLLGRPEAAGLREQLGPRELRSDEQGRLVLDDACSGTWQLVARPPAALPSPPLLVEVEPGSEPAESGATRVRRAIDGFELRMPGGTAVHGRVVQATGDETLPLPGVRVTGRAGGPASRGPKAETVSGADGRFRLDGFPAGPATLAFEGEGIAPREVTLEQPGATGDVALVRWGRLSFELIDPGSDVPPEEAEVTLLARGADGWVADGELRTVSRTDARFVVAEVAPGERAAWIRAEGFLPRALSPFSVAPGRSTDLGALLLDRGHSVEGLVVTAHGERPVAGAEVRIDGAPRRRGRGVLRPPATVTGPDGRFELSGLPAGERLLLVRKEGFADHPDHAARIAPGLRADDGDEAIVVRLLEPGELAVRLEDARGDPVAGRALSARSDAGSWGASCRATDEAGTCTFSEVPPGRVTVRPTRGEGASGGVEVRPGERAVLTIREVGVIVRGRILSEGVPVPGVVSLGSHSLPWDLQSPEYELRDVPVGRHEVAIDHAYLGPDGEPLTGSFARVRRELVVPAGITELVHDFHVHADRNARKRDGPEDEPAPVTVSGVLRDADTGEPLGMGVVAGGPGRRRAEATTDHEGRFAITLPRSGTWRLGALLPPGGAWLPGDPVEIAVEDGAVVAAPDPLLLTARRAWLARLRLVLPAGGAGEIPVAGAGCWPFEPPFVNGAEFGAYAAPVTSDALGMVLLRIGEAGPRDVACEVPGRALLLVPGLEFVRGEEPRARAVSPGPTGSLLLPRGADTCSLVEPVTGSRWRLPAIGGPPLTSLARRASGGVEVRGLPPGTWTVDCPGAPSVEAVVAAGSLTAVP